jgi:hypothetical protein
MLLVRNLRHMTFDELEELCTCLEVVRMRANQLECKIVETDWPLRVAALIFYDIILESGIR